MKTKTCVIPARFAKDYLDAYSALSVLPAKPGDDEEKLKSMKAACGYNYHELGRAIERFTDGMDDEALRFILYLHELSPLIHEYAAKTADGGDAVIWKDGLPTCRVERDKQDEFDSKVATLRAMYEEDIADEFARRARCEKLFESGEIVVRLQPVYPDDIPARVSGGYVDMATRPFAD